MRKITTSDELKAAIVELKIQQAQLGIELHDQFNLAFESMKPVNLIKSAFKEVTGADDVPGSLLGTSLGFGAGYLSKILLQNTLRRPINRLIGTALMFGLQTFISKNPETLKAIGSGIFGMFRRRKRRNDEPEQEPIRQQMNQSDQYPGTF